MEEKKLKEVAVPEISTSAESTLNTVAGVVLVLGLIGTIVLMCTTLTEDRGDKFNPMGFALTLGGLPFHTGHVGNAQGGSEYLVAHSGSSGNDAASFSGRY